MKIEYNHNCCDAVMDLRTGKVWRYGDAGFHENFGGKRFYTSQTGNSFAGWIPEYPWVRRVGSYRIDVPRLDVWFRNDGVAGKIFVMPFAYQGGSADEYPLVAIIKGEGGGSLFLLDPQNSEEGKRFLLGGAELERREVSIDFIPAPGEEIATKMFVVFVTKNRRFATGVIRRVVEAVHLGQLEFRSTVRSWTPPFWTNLGLHDHGGDLYKITSGIARAKYSRDVLLADAAALQGVAPKNVAVVAPGVYLQKRKDDYYSAAGMITVDGDQKAAYLGDEAYQEIRYELLDEAAAVRAMLGDIADLRRRLEEAAK